MPDLTAFLLARIAEDEKLAWRLVPGGTDRHFGTWTPDSAFLGLTPDGYERAHIARWDPARVLAECEAKRRIIELHYDRTPEDMIAEYREDGEGWTPTCAECSCYSDCVVELPCPTLRALASMYVDHPGFDPSWRVE